MFPFSVQFSYLKFSLIITYHFVLIYYNIHHFWKDISYKATRLIFCIKLFSEQYEIFIKAYRKKNIFLCEFDIKICKVVE